MATTIPSPDDIDELFREMELEPIAYRSFERRVPGRHSQPAELQRGGDVLTGAVAARLLEPETVSPLRDPRAIESIVQTVGSALDGAIAAPASRPASGVSLRVYSAGAGAGPRPCWRISHTNSPARVGRSWPPMRSRTRCYRSISGRGGRGRDSPTCC